MQTSLLEGEGRRPDTCIHVQESTCCTEINSCDFSFLIVQVCVSSCNAVYAIHCCITLGVRFGAFRVHKFCTCMHDYGGCNLKEIYQYNSLFITEVKTGMTWSQRSVQTSSPLHPTHEHNPPAITQFTHSQGKPSCNASCHIEHTWSVHIRR